MGVSLADLITLAKAGYTPGQVKELIALSEKEPEGTKPEEQQKATAPTSEAATASAEPVKASENAAQPEEPKKEEIDYKSLYEKSQEDLKQAQAVNRSKDLSSHLPDPQSELKDIFGSYIY